MNKPVDEWKDKRTQLEMYWAKKGPLWDDITVAVGKMVKRDYC